jgi:hypothetical protein
MEPSRPSPTHPCRSLVLDPVPTPKGPGRVRQARGVESHRKYQGTQDPLISSVGLGWVRSSVVVEGGGYGCVLGKCTSYRPILMADV